MTQADGPIAKPGDTVRLHYVGLLPDGRQFDSSRNRDPLTVRLGAGEIIAGLERQVRGMAIGECQRVMVPAAEAYGLRDPGRIRQVARGLIPANINLRPGTRLQAHPPGGEPVIVTVTDITPDMVTIDANHPLAGQDLIFDVELVAIIQAA